MSAIISNIDTLVSIVVITYNSQEYVVETLESAYKQTYKNIELIITDDGSSDDTVRICKDWLLLNSARFVRTEIITVTINSGTSSNCNRGVSISQGDWIKFIAGDDILLDNCIEGYVNFVYKHELSELVFGRVKYLKGKEQSEDKPIKLFSLNLAEQEKEILRGSGIKAPTVFVKKSLLIRCGGFNEKYKIIDDLPLWLKLSKMGVLFYCTSEFTVLYRIHNQNSTVKGVDNFISLNYFKEVKEIIVTEINPRLMSLGCYGTYFHNLNYLFVTRLIIFFGNRKNYISKFLELFILKRTMEKIKKVFS